MLLKAMSCCSRFGSTAFTERRQPPTPVAQADPSWRGRVFEQIASIQVSEVYLFLSEG